MDEPTRADLFDAIAYVRERLAKAEDVYQCDRSRSLFLCRDVMIARVEYEAVVKELVEFDQARSLSYLYRSERRSRR